MIFTIAILAISLSLDALGVGIVYGLRRIKIPLTSKLVICLFSIVYSGAALLLGNALSNIIHPYISKLIGIAILAIMGIWIIIQAMLKDENDIKKEGTSITLDEPLIKIVIKSLGITIQVIKNPLQGDMDKSGVIDLTESLLLGLALSVDAIGVGIGSALAGFRSPVVPFAVGLFQLLFLYAGIYLGDRIIPEGKMNKKVLSLLPGILLIVLALIRIR